MLRLAHIFAFSAPMISVSAADFLNKYFKNDNDNQYQGLGESKNDNENQGLGESNERGQDGGEKGAGSSFLEKSADVDPAEMAALAEEKKTKDAELAAERGRTTQPSAAAQHRQDSRARNWQQSWLKQPDSEELAAEEAADRAPGEAVPTPSCPPKNFAKHFKNGNGRDRVRNGMMGVRTTGRCSVHNGDGTCWVATWGWDNAGASIL